VPDARDDLELADLATVCQAGLSDLPWADRVAGIPLLTPLGLMNHNRTISGVNVGHLWGQIAVLREELQAVLAL